MRKINKIIVHCSDSTFGDSSDIDQWHKEKGWSGIGYHFVILNGTRDKGSMDAEINGFIETGRGMAKSGAHCRGHNRDSVGICMIGTDTFTKEQYIALKALVEGLKSQFSLSDSDVYGHRDFDPHKTCPNFDTRVELAKISN